MKTVEPLFLPKEIEIVRLADGGIDVYAKKKSLYGLFVALAIIVVGSWVFGSFVTLMGGFGAVVFIALIVGGLYFLFMHEGGKAFRERIYSKDIFKNTGKKIEIRKEGIYVKGNFYKIEHVHGFTDWADEQQFGGTMMIHAKVQKQISIRYGIYNYGTHLTFDKLEAYKIIVVLNELLSEVQGGNSRNALMRHQSTKF